MTNSVAFQESLLFSKMLVHSFSLFRLSADYLNKQFRPTECHHLDQNPVFLKEYFEKQSADNKSM